MLAVEDGKATVELSESENCKSCGLCVSAADRKMSLVVDAVDGLEPGQTVIVAIDRSTSLVSVFFLFGLPLAGLIIGAGIGHFLPFPGMSPMSPDASAILLGIVLFVAAFLVAFIYDRTVAQKRMPKPTIMRIEPQ